MFLEDDSVRFSKNGTTSFIVNEENVAAKNYQIKDQENVGMFYNDSNDDLKLTNNTVELSLHNDNVTVNKILQTPGVQFEQSVFNAYETVSSTTKISGFNMFELDFHPVFITQIGNVVQLTVTGGTIDIITLGTVDRATQSYMIPERFRSTETLTGTFILTYSTDGDYVSNYGVENGLIFFSVDTSDTSQTVTYPALSVSWHV